MILSRQALPFGGPASSLCPSESNLNQVDAAEQRPTAHRSSAETTNSNQELNQVEQRRPPSLGTCGAIHPWYPYARTCAHLPALARALMRGRAQARTLTHITRTRAAGRRVRRSTTLSAPKKAPVGGPCACSSLGIKGGLLPSPSLGVQGRAYQACQELDTPGRVRALGACVREPSAPT